MEKLKIIKLEEDIFKHIIDESNDSPFYNTNSLKFSLIFGIIMFELGSKVFIFRPENITVYPSADSAAIEINTIDEFVIALKNLGYSLIKSDPALQWDSIIPSTTATTDVFTYKLGTTTVLTKTITYTDSTKSTIQKIEKI